ncbi:hypothetical protein A2313_01415 [Candidatus Roizmanbacteria bacterium RIFOXYB2_FULL_41_10]|uniref:HTH cro/C1-type domain-containing protein n=1 Tax=Candidatus Roizmanbacteria bacterium RIFOXYA1_FULL_41_12 TaxID=1802082 RepID=A0A1F7K940_9BACT|nr:MAG: hypothetical protein A2209_02635 [Candidatus Roizmanbacteria bacterium RIFOXYA1_FULL_41_12]OGK66362.1 MAG: hypothetical protein A2262_02695 [Candidatus Roizmanbacteria bacterium RIFOXYA2_FULL_41_8]OGK71032.1 MAG: hypothetical protein A2313_01415 [Candidatus Roizmanbacteria bacterium RIFOXYB2_FULL_41_10]OGK71329.1 MAG: hypothetical protein A2403_00895 [Candidatus Roizmanbacteria bacterium RIFOXYC1_FULL_41_16]OGK74405.1 MAG: hypothetical protein A2459_03505 [Candidatus Roizmanbacteria bac
MSKRSIYKIIGFNIQILRRELDMTQEKLAILTAIDRSYLGKMENGRVNPSLQKLFFIALTLKIPLSTLFKNGVVE